MSHIPPPYWVECLPYTRSLKSSSVVMSGQRFTLLMWTTAEKGFAECIHAADVAVMSKLLTGRLKLDLESTDYVA